MLYRLIMAVKTPRDLGDLRWKAELRERLAFREQSPGKSFIYSDNSSTYSMLSPVLKIDLVSKLMALTAPWR